MKRFFTLALMGCAMLFALSGCLHENGAGTIADTDLVFVNQSDAVIAAVTADFLDQSGGAQNADGSPLKRGETFRLQAGAYPVTLTVYDTPFDGSEQRELARCTVDEAPPEGQQWYVTARDGAGGLTLLTSTHLLDPDEAG